MRDYQNLDNVLDNVELSDFQRQGLQQVFTNKKMLLAFDTGVGKTFTYSGIVRGLLNRNPEKKHVVLIISDSIVQVPKDIRSLTGVSVETFDGSEESAGRLRYFWERTSIFCLTMEAMRQPGVVLHLFKHLPEIESIAIDEAHHCSNWDTSDTAFMIRSLCLRVPYIVELTATPVTRTNKQYYRLMNLMDRNLSMHRDESFRGRYTNRYFFVNRDDYGMKGDYTPTLILVPPSLEQSRKQKGIVFKGLKGYGATAQVKALVETVKDRLSQGKRVLVYLHYHDTRHWVEQNFEEQGIAFTSLHGKLRNRKEKDAALNCYKAGDVDVLITSVTESLNIDADVVIFYEFTTLVKQVIGRAHRGLEGKKLEVAFVITEHEDEIEYFLKYVYARSLAIQNLLHKDYSELIAIGERLKQLKLD